MKKIFFIPLMLLFILSCGDYIMDAYDEMQFDASSKAISSFRFEADNNAALSATRSGVISGDQIHVVVPFGTAVGTFTPTIRHTGKSISPGSGEEQDFTGSETVPVQYTVTVYDGTTIEYEVTVTVAANDAKNLDNFQFKSDNNAWTSGDYGGVYNGTNITVTVPHDANVAALKASFETDGMSVYVDSTQQTSNITENNFTNPVTYTVYAHDGSTQNYVVTVEKEAPSAAKEITGFWFDKTYNLDLSVESVSGIIDQVNKTITVQVPSGTDVTALKASFTTDGYKVFIGDWISGTEQTSDWTTNDFTTPKTYRVYSEGYSSYQDYVVTVNVGG